MQIVLDMHMHEMQIFAAMTFDEFLAEQKITNAEAAQRLQRDQTLIGRYRARSVTPSPEIIADIVEWAEGTVSPRELLALPKQGAA
jgi:hypothetical protein